jgi:ATP-dependent RNA helicase DeaD
MTRRSPSLAESPGFAGLGLDDRILSCLTSLGYEEPTPIQTAAIPPLLAGRDVLAQAATGTGKTAAFALPLLHRLADPAAPRGGVAAVILVPTRELAMQVSEAVHRYGKLLDVHVLAIYGGASMSTQIRALRRGVDVVVATPGRAVDHLRRGTLDLTSVRTIVLDEADEMHDMGFAEDLEAILAATPDDKQTALFSATMPPRIGAIVQAHLDQPVTIELAARVRRADAAANVRQVAHVVPRAHKLDALGRILDIEHPVSAIVFCRTRIEVDELSETLAARGHRAEALHGGLSQEQRDKVMQRFRTRKVDLLIATDVAARGLDVQHVSHVVNYDVPVAAEVYTHRIGRTGRAGRTGAAITLAEPREHRLLRNIERATKQRIEVTPLPTVADLHARRQEVARTALRASIVAGDLDRYRGIVESLAEEFDVMDVAAAALKQADTRADEADDVDIPAASFPTEPAPHAARGTQRGREPGPSGRTSRGALGAMTRLFVAGGHALRITPADLVGAIANEAGLSGKEIGTIQIEARHATVEVPLAKADAVVAALAATKLKGKRIRVTRDRYAGAERSR